MAKRLTDTEKWHRNKWFRKLPLIGKLFWLYLCDNCDHAGIWDVDWEDVEYCFGMSVNPKMLTELLGKRYALIAGGEKWFLAAFVEFQYGRLEDTNRVHKSIINRLKKYSISLRALQAPLKVKEGAKDKDKDKDKDMKEVLRYLNEKTGKHFRAAPPELHARLEDYSVADCKQVIDNMAEKWLGTDQAQYLRPLTLFCPSKFEGYLNANVNAKPTADLDAGVARTAALQQRIDNSQPRPQA